MNFWSLLDGGAPKCCILVTIYIVTWRWEILFPVSLLGTVLGPLIEEFIYYLRLFSYFHKNEDWATFAAFFLTSHILPNQMDQSHEIEEFWANDEN